MRYAYFVRTILWYLAGTGVGLPDAVMNSMLHQPGEYLGGALVPAPFGKGKY